MIWSSSYISLPGERPLNEDFVSVFTSGDLFCAVLCDGLGGHDGGEIASRCVCESVQKTISGTDQGTDLSVLIKKAIDTAQEDLLAEQKRLHKTGEMNTTLCCLLLRDGKGVAAHVGDSRIYHFHHCRISGRTLDHSVPQYLVNTGQLRASQVRHHEDRNRLLRVMGVEWETPRYEVWELPPLSAGDAFLLCSDGFWEWILDWQMEFQLFLHPDISAWLESMREIVEKRGRGKKMDNYSAVVIKMK